MIITDLPPEIIFNIFNYVDIIDLSSLSLTCSYFYFISAKQSIKHVRKVIETEPTTGNYNNCLYMGSAVEFMCEYIKNELKDFNLDNDNFRHVLRYDKHIMSYCLISKWRLYHQHADNYYLLQIVTIIDNVKLFKLYYTELPKFDYEAVIPCVNFYASYNIAQYMIKNTLISDYESMFGMCCNNGYADILDMILNESKLKYNIDEDVMVVNIDVYKVLNKYGYFNERSVYNFMYKAIAMNEYDSLRYLIIENKFKYESLRIDMLYQKAINFNAEIDIRMMLIEYKSRGRLVLF